VAEVGDLEVALVVEHQVLDPQVAVRHALIGGRKGQRHLNNRHVDQFCGRNPPGGLLCDQMTRRSRCATH